MRSCTILFVCVLVVFASCNGQDQKPSGSKATPVTAFAVGDPVSGLGKNIDCIYQDKDGNYWFASNGEGVYRYDGKTMRHITSKHGLCSDFVWGVQADVHGKLWFATRDGICSFDGIAFTNHTDAVRNANFGTLVYKKGGLFFNHPGGICFYDGNSFTNFTISPATYKPQLNNAYRPYDVYCTLVDSTGKVWFGTQEKGVGVYDGKTVSFITGKDLDGPAVRSIYRDGKGIFWFGNNGGGLYRYDGKTLRNITEEKNLGNEDFLRGHKLLDKAGSLARVFAINEDRDGNLWLGTIDAGVWKYDGTNLTNYTAKDGLSGNSVNVIYKDKEGDLLFVSNGDAVNRFDGQKFSKISF